MLAESYIYTGMKAFFLFPAVLLALFCAPLSKAIAVAGTQAPSVAGAEAYLDGLTTAQARFLQTAPNGTQLIGTFYLSRPGRLRFSYDPPVKDFIVADGLFLYFYDSELGEQSNAPIGQTLADFLLRPDLRLSGDITVTDVRHDGELLRITLTQTADPDAGTLTLGFTENPLALKKWRVTDGTGAITEIELFQMETGVVLDDTLFVYADPNRGSAPHYND